jgi:hypothetical protein
MDRAPPRARAHRTPRILGFVSTFCIHPPPITGAANLVAVFYMFQRSVELKFAVCNHGCV